VTYGPAANDPFIGARTYGFLTDWILTVTASKPERDQEIWERYSAVGSQASVAREYGLTQAAVSKAVQRHRATIPPEVREEKQRDELAFHERARDEIVAIARLKPGPVVAGKDGQPVHDPITGDVVWDYTGQLTAWRTAMQVSAHIARLGGLEAPTRLDITATEQAATEQAAVEAAAFVAGGRDDDR
jgi:hypothetical protein